MDETQIIDVSEDKNYEAEDVEKIAKKEVFAKKVRNNKKKLGKIMALISIVLLISMTLILHYYFQCGLGAKYVNSIWLHALFITFGKLVFVLSTMILLNTIVKIWKDVPYFIANNAIIQIIGNLSFAMYLYHYTMINFRVGNQEDVSYQTNYFVFGGFLGD